MQAGQPRQHQLNGQSDLLQHQLVGRFVSESHQQRAGGHGFGAAQRERGPLAQPSGFAQLLVRGQRFIGRLVIEAQRPLVVQHFVERVLHHLKLVASAVEAVEMTDRDRLHAGILAPAQHHLGCRMLRCEAVDDRQRCAAEVLGLRYLGHDVQRGDQTQARFLGAGAGARSACRRHLGPGVWLPRRRHFASVGRRVVAGDVSHQHRPQHQLVEVLAFALWNAEQCESAVAPGQSHDAAPDFFA